MNATFREYLRHDATSGKFFWVKRPNSKAAIGSEAGVLNSNGYRQIKLRGQRYYAHRLAWWFVYGAAPANEIDHINGVPDDNRIANLRECSRAENMQNRPAKGAYFNARRGVWVAEITAFGKKQKLGSFQSEDEARAAFQAARAERQPFCRRSAS